MASSTDRGSPTGLTNIGVQFDLAASGDPNAQSTGSVAVADGLRISVNSSMASMSHSRAFASQLMTASRGAQGGADGIGGVGVVIPDQVYFCGEREVNHLPNVQLRRITAFLSVAEEVSPPGYVTSADLEASRVRYLHLPLRDDHTTTLREHFKTAFRFLDTCRAEGRRVMVYCRKGQSRSASIVAGYLMKEENISFDAALGKLRQHRRADPHFLFCQQLDTFHREDFNVSSSVVDAPGMHPAQPDALARQHPHELPGYLVGAPIPGASLLGFCSLEPDTALDWRASRAGATRSTTEPGVSTTCDAPRLMEAPMDLGATLPASSTPSATRAEVRASHRFHASRMLEASLLTNPESCDIDSGNDEDDPVVPVQPRVHAGHERDPTGDALTRLDAAQLQPTERDLTEERDFAEARKWLNQSGVIGGDGRLSLNDGETHV